MMLIINVDNKKHFNAHLNKASIPTWVYPGTPSIRLIWKYRNFHPWRNLHFCTKSFKSLCQVQCISIKWLGLQNDYIITKYIQLVNYKSSYRRSKGTFNLNVTHGKKNPLHTFFCRVLEVDKIIYIGHKSKIKSSDKNQFYPLYTACLTLPWCPGKNNLCHCAS